MLTTKWVKIDITLRDRFAGFGRRVTTSTGLEDIWEGPTANRPWPSDAGTLMEVVSTSASDTAVGIGARAVHVYYLDASGAYQSQVITLNGLTPVAIATPIRRVLGSCHVSTVGTNGAPVGDISIQSVGGAVVYERWPVGGNRSLSCAQTVPKGKVFYLAGWHASVTGGKDCSVFLRASYDENHGTNLPGVMLFQDVAELSSGAINVSFNGTPIVIPELVDIEVVIQSAQVGARVAARFEGWLDNA